MVITIYAAFGGAGAGVFVVGLLVLLSDLLKPPPPPPQREVPGEHLPTAPATVTGGPSDADELKKAQAENAAEQKRVKEEHERVVEKQNWLRKQVRKIRIKRRP